MVDDQMGHPLGRLHLAARQHHARAHGDRPEPFENIGPEDQIGHAGLVLQGHETDALGRAGPLADQHHPADRDLPAVGPRRIGLRRQGPDACQPFAQEADRMALQRQAEGLVVADHLLGRGQHRQGRGRAAVGLIQPHGLEQGRRRRRGRAPGRPDALPPGQIERPVSIRLGQPVQRRRGQGSAAAQVVEVEEGAVCPRCHDRLGPVPAEAVDGAHPQPQGVAAAARAGLQGGVPVAGVDVRVAHLDPVLAGVADDLGRGVEAHRLAVQQAGCEDVRIQPFYPGRDIDQMGEGAGVALGEAVFAEPLDLVETVLRELGVIAARYHPPDHLLLEIADGAVVPEGGHGAAQAIGLLAGELGRDHGDLHRLFLEQGYAQGLAQDIGQFVRIGGRARHGKAVAARTVPRLMGPPFQPPLQIGVHHIALDRSGPDDGDLDHQIVELHRPQPRQHRHLGPALDLKDADRIRPAQHAIDPPPLDRHGGCIGQGPAIGGLDHAEGPLHRRQHAERQHIDLHQLEKVDVVLVPFDEGAVGHGRIADGHDLDQRALAEHKAADVLAEMAGEPDQFGGQFEGQFHADVVAAQTGAIDMLVLHPAPS